MKKAAFAAVAVLAVIALSGSNLLLQAPREDVQEVRELPAGAQQDRTVSPEEMVADLRAEYVRLAQIRAKALSEKELRKAIQEMQWISEFAPIIEQLQAILRKHAPSTPVPATDASTFAASPVPAALAEANQVRLKAQLAIQVLQTQDAQTLLDVQETLTNQRRGSTIPRTR